jgi:hypothetical protein
MKIIRETLLLLPDLLWGIRYILVRPRDLFWAVLPVILGITTFALAVGFLFSWSDAVLGTIWHGESAFFRTVGEWLVVLLGAIAAGAVGFAVTIALGSVCVEFIIERYLEESPVFRMHLPFPGVGGLLRMFAASLARGIVFSLIALVTLLCAVIPPLAVLALALNVLALGAGIVDLPLGAARLPIGRRLQIEFSRFEIIVPMGLLCMLLALVPLLPIVLFAPLHLAALRKIERLQLLPTP